MGYTGQSTTEKSPSKSLWSFSCSRDLWSDTWLWETLATIFSGLLFILIVILLKNYDQKPVPQFAYDITLNAIISILATLSKSCLLIAVTGAISQLKWRWYENSKGRRVFDMQLFDDVSRGPWGSIIILTRAYRWPLVSIGAFVSILALAFGPLTQQVITYPSRVTLTSDPAAQPSAVSRARTYLAGDPGAAISTVWQIVEGALWDLSSDHDGLPVAHCPTGNCTWDEFESLALCSSCQNRTMDVGITGCTLTWNASVVQQTQESPRYGDYIFEFTKNCSFQLPPDFFCDVSPNFSITAEAWRSDSHPYWYASKVRYPSDIFVGSGSLGTLENVADGPENPKFMTDNGRQKLDPWNLMSFCHIQVGRESNHGVGTLSIRQATTCQLTPCVKRYSFSVQNGIPALNSLGDRYGSWYINASGIVFSNGKLYDANTGQLFRLNASAFVPSWSDVIGENGRFTNLGNMSSPSNFSSSSYTINTEDLFSLHLQRVFNGQIPVADAFADDERNSVSNSSGLRFKEQFFVRQTMLSFEFQILRLLKIGNQGGLTWAIPQVAGKVNKFLREKGGIQVPGKSYTIVAVVEVRWYWLSLPAVTWITGTGFLIMTMWICRRDDQTLWKSSSLPLLYHGFDAEDLEVINSAATEVDKVSGMESLAKSLQASFRKDPVTGQLKLTKL